MSNGKRTYLVVGSILKNDKGNLRLEFKAAKNANEDTVAAIERITEALGGNVLFINNIDDEFRTEKGIPEYVRSRVSMPVNDEPETDGTDEEDGF